MYPKSVLGNLDAYSGTWTYPFYVLRFPSAATGDIFNNSSLTPYNLYEQTRAISMVSNRCLDLALAQNR